MLFSVRRRIQTYILNGTLWWECTSEKISETARHIIKAQEKVKVMSIQWQSLRVYLSSPAQLPLTLHTAYLRGWHSSPRLRHTSARPGGLHMYTLLNHPSVIWATSRSCCSAGGLRIGSDWWRGKKEQKTKIQIGNDGLSKKNRHTGTKRTQRRVCICSLLTSFSFK